MRLNTLYKYKFSADVYVPRVQNDTAGTTVYELLPENANMPVQIVSGRQQTYMFTEKAVEYGARLLDVRNPFGKLIFVENTADGDEEYDMHIHGVYPVVDVYGNLVGYRSVLRRPQPILEDVRPSAHGGD